MWIGNDGYGLRRDGVRDRGIRKVSDSLENGKVSECSEDTTGNDNAFAPDAIGKTAKYNEEWRADEKRACDQEICRLRINFECLREKKECIELTRVPHDGLPGRCAEEREKDDAQIAPTCKAFGQRRF